MKKKFVSISVILLSLLLIGCSVCKKHDWRVITKHQIPKCETPNPEVMAELGYHSDRKKYLFGETTIIEECRECGQRQETKIYGDEEKSN